MKNQNPFEPITPETIAQAKLSFKASILKKYRLKKGIFNT